jgi:hypothetical protein
MKYSKIRSFLVSIIAGIILNGCASMMDGYFSNRITNLIISTDPANAEVFIYDNHGILKFHDSTPVRLNTDSVNGKSPFRILIKKTLYEEQELTLEKKFNLWADGI